MRKGFVRTLYILILFLGFSACQQKKENSNKIIKIEGFDIPLAKSTANFTPTIKVIPLEKNEKDSFTHVTKVIEHNNLLFVQTNRSISCFDKSGKFIRFITYTTKSSKENSFMNTFFLNEEDNTINVLKTRQHKILTYSFNGELINEKDWLPMKNEIPFESLLINHDSLLLANTINNNSNNIYTIFNLKKNQTNILKNTEIQSNEISVKKIHSPFSFYNNSCLLLLLFDNKIYSYHNETFTPYYEIVTSKKILTQKKHKTINSNSILIDTKLSKEGYFLGFNGIYQTNQLIMLTTFNNQSFIFDRNSYKSIHYKNFIHEKIKRMPVMDIVGSTPTSFINFFSSYHLSEIIKGIPTTCTNNNLLKLKEAYNTSIKTNNTFLIYYTFKEK